jgi:two-component system sensor histidine kinase BaeS
LNAALVVSEGRQREFLLSVSHELRTPLTAVKGYGEALADRVLAESEIPDVGGTVAREAERLHRLVNDLLELARLGAVDFRIQVADIDASQVVSDAAAVWRDRCAREGVTFQVEGVGAPAWVESDAMRLRQIIDNLAENALRVSPDGSQVAFAIHRDPVIAGPGYIAIEVRDGGPGLTPQDIDVAFEPGALHERYRGVRPVGTGLGLALVARLASGMGGSATATSLPGEGTSFWVRIPAAATQT